MITDIDKAELEAKREELKMPLPPEDGSLLLLGATCWYCEKRFVWFKEGVGPYDNHGQSQEDHQTHCPKKPTTIPDWWQ